MRRTRWVSRGLFGVLALGVYACGGALPGQGVESSDEEESAVATSTAPLIQTGPSLLQPRSSAQVFRLPDGKYLLAGGTTWLSGNPPLRLELYDEVSSTWSTGPSLPNNLFYQAGAQLADGSVLVKTTGAPFVRILNSLATSAVPNIPLTATANPTLTALPGGDALLLINELVQVGTGTDYGPERAFRYVKSSNTWLPLPNPAVTPFHATCDAGDGRVLLFVYGYPAKWTTFDPAQNQFATPVEFAPRIQLPAAGGMPNVNPKCVHRTLPDGRQLSFNDYESDGSIVFQRASASAPWVQLGRLGTRIAKYRAIALLSDNRSVVFAGGGAATSPVNNAIDVFDLQTLTWSTPNTMAHKRMQVASIAMTNGSMMLAGGFSGTTGTDTGLVEFFRPAATCQPQTTCGTKCGPVNDGCGGTLQCPPCPSVGPLTATYNATFKTPACTARSTSCSSGTLLLGRAGLGPEANAPNTIASTCGDGFSGSFHGDESSDAIRVSSADGLAIAEGKTVRISVDVWAWTGYTSDKLDIFVAPNANSPVWTLVTTLTPTKAAASTLEVTTPVPVSTSGTVAVRAQFRYGGASTSACYAGGYNDHDDLVFAVR